MNVLLTSRRRTSYQSFGRSLGFAAAVAMAFACADGSSPDHAGSLVLNVLGENLSFAAVDNWTATVSGPSGERTASGAPGATVTISDLLPGSYTIALEGRENGIVTYTGQGTASVSAGSTSQATVNAAPRIFDITIDVTEAELDAFGATVQLTATVRENGTVIQGATPRWIAAGSVASVNASGLVTALDNGTETITAELGESSAQATVTVDQETVVIAVLPADPTLLVNQTVQLTAQSRDANDHPVEDEEYTWSSEDEGVATVDENGLVTAQSVGTVEITANDDDGVHGSTTITVAPIAWIPTGNMTQARTDAFAFDLGDGTVLVVGTSNAELYDIASGMFSSLGNLAFNHGFGVVATQLQDGRVLITGGSSSSQAAEVFDPSTGMFTQVGAMNVSRLFHSATVLDDGRVLLTGGRNTATDSTQWAAELFNPGTNSFTTTGNMLGDRNGHSSTLLPDGQVLISGGIRTTSPGSGIALSTAELYNPATEMFSSTGNLNESRTGHEAVPLNDGTVLILGWVGLTAEIYNPSSGQFTPTGSMRIGHNAGTATLLTDGRVLVAGGVTSGAAGNVTISSVDIYDPDAGRFDALPNMNAARQQHAAVLLSDGRVLVMGGAVLGGSTLSSAELFPNIATVPAIARR